MILYGFWRSSATWRVRAALAYKEIPFEYRPVNLQKEGGGEQFSADHLAKNPMAQVPVIEDVDDGKPVRIAQSMAILEYLEERFPEKALLPKDRAMRARVRHLSELVNAGIQPLQNTAVRNHVVEKGLDGKAWIQRWVGRGLEALEAEVATGSGRFAVGDTPTFADVFLVPQLFFARRFDLDMAKLPRLLAIEAACNELEAFRRAHAHAQPDYPGDTKT